jgi:3-deoxy-D-manno-octulosonate 8-phosphate phosphatase (KDO 8-P phosphatase)
MVKEEFKMLEERASRIKLLILDVDGVMTDGRIIMNDLGQEIKYFNVKDGHGLRLLLRAGIHVAIITGRESKTVAHRASDLGIRDVYQGVEDKKSVCEKLLYEKGLLNDEVCCIGDDLPDIPMFECVGFPIAVADATKETRESALYVTRNSGGNGAVREVCELILKARNLWPEIKGLHPKNKLGFT